MSEGVFCKSLIATFWYSDFIHMYVFNFHVGYHTLEDSISLN